MAVKASSEKERKGEQMIRWMQRDQTHSTTAVHRSRLLPVAGPHLPQCLDPICTHTMRLSHTHTHTHSDAHASSSYSSGAEDLCKANKSVMVDRQKGNRPLTKSHRMLDREARLEG